jgi:hypothetical protein
MPLACEIAQVPDCDRQELDFVGKSYQNCSQPPDSTRLRPMLFPYFRNVSTTIEDLDSRHRDLSGTASIYILRNQISVQRDLSGVPSSAGEEPERGRTVKRFRCPLRLPVRHKLSLRAIAAVSDGDLQAQTSGPPATDPETPIDYLSTLIQYLLSIAQHYCHLQYSRDLAHEFLDPTRWP